MGRWNGSRKILSVSWPAASGERLTPLHERKQKKALGSREMKQPDLQEMHTKNWDSLFFSHGVGFEKKRFGEKKRSVRPELECDGACGVETR